MSLPTHKMVQVSWDCWEYVPDEKKQKEFQAEAKQAAARHRKERGYAAS